MWKVGRIRFNASARRVEYCRFESDTFLRAFTFYRIFHYFSYMSDEEQEFARAIETYLEERGSGVAWRHKQARFTEQKLDIFVDLPETRFTGLGIEHKAVKLDSTNKLYFSSHFSEKETDDGELIHQIDAISEFLDRSGRVGWLAIQVRRGRGKPTDTYMLTWEFVKSLYEDEDEAGIDLRLLDEWSEDRREVLKLERESSQWVIDDRVYDYLLYQ